ncbi:MAG: two-component system regulatory protein YycI [Bacillota bacterium]|nr:two-component system regulatory protein YycI [Bacillota bacterium]MDW7677321.1 two-component system regulatory protein YycI [Bacillota bacterium]
MDWTKAKTILIAAFIMTNLFLAASLLQDPARQEVAAVNEPYRMQTVQFLEDLGMTLETELPRTIPTLAPMTVEYRFFSPVDTAVQFLGDDWELVSMDTFEKEGARLRIVNDKQLIYQRFEAGENLPNMNETTLTEVSDTFLRERGLFTDGLQLTQIYLGTVPEYHPDPLHKLVYEQTYHGRFMGESYVHVYLNQWGIVAVEALLLEDPADIEQTGTPRAMIDAPEALLRKLDEILADQLGEGPIVVSRIEAGYYFALTGDPITPWESVASGTAVPAWKIILKNGDTYYQEAF